MNIAIAYAVGLVTGIAIQWIWVGQKMLTLITEWLEHLEKSLKEEFSK